MDIIRSENNPTTEEITTDMDVFETIAARRSVKQYDPAHRMSEADERKLLEAALLSPTSFNIQNWRFVVVSDPEARAQIKAAAWGQAQVTDASLLIVLTADLKAWAKQPDRYWRNAPPETQQMLIPMIGQFYNGRDQVQRDEAMRSAGIAAQTLMLAAKGLGYDSCPMIGFDPEAVGRIIRLPEDHVIGLMLAIGKALTPARPRGGQLPFDEVVLRNHF